jgi:hypothetical protein
MLMSLSKKIELIANVAIIVVACLLATVLVKNYFFAKPPQQADRSESQRMFKVRANLLILRLCHPLISIGNKTSRR